jgi:hypothetical protein
MDDNRTEWSLSELIDDPLVGLVMRSDGVDRHSIELLFERVASSSRYRCCEALRSSDY